MLHNVNGIKHKSKNSSLLHDLNANATDITFDIAAL